jgi:hypothetical protein
MKIESGDHSMRIRMTFDSNSKCLKSIQILSVERQRLEPVAFRRSCADHWRRIRRRFNGRLRSRGTSKCAPGPPELTDWTPSGFTGR